MALKLFLSGEMLSHNILNRHEFRTHSDKMGELVESAMAELAEELSQCMGLSIPAPELLKVAGAMLATETVKSALDLLVPSVSSAMSFSTTG